MSIDGGFAEVTAFIRPQKENAVIRALYDLAPFPGFSLSEVRGQGSGRGVGGRYAATEDDLSYQSHLKLQMICPAIAAADICRMIAEAAWTGQRGDGLVYSTPVVCCVRIRELGGPIDPFGPRVLS